MRPMEDYVPYIVADGFTEEQAEDILEIIWEEGVVDLRGPEAATIYPYTHLKLLPYLDSKFDVDYDKFFKDTENEISSLIGNILRYRNLWKDRINEETQELIRINSALNSFGSQFTSYCDIFFETFPDDNLMRSYLSNSKYDAWFNPLPFLTHTPLEELPEEVGQGEVFSFLINRYLDLSEARATENIIGMRHLSFGFNAPWHSSTGKCGDLERYHQATILGQYFSSNEEDFVLLYVQGDLVGSMKMVGDRSILGLSHFKDESGCSVIVPGGTYRTFDVIEDKIEDWFSRLRNRPGRINLSNLNVQPLRLFGHHPSRYEEGKSAKKMEQMYKKITENYPQQVDLPLVTL